MSCTCQICGREIKAGKGVIAKHGYKRPGGGYQTSSCFGAGFRPYEISCDAIERFMAIVEKSRDDSKRQRAELFANPPATIERVKRDAWGSVRARVSYDRPAGFDASTTSTGSYRPDTYAGEWAGKVNSLARYVAGCDLDLKFLKERHDGWKAAA
jgi:hypothetical protein